LENGSVALSKEASKFVPAQRFAGMQVIDNRGTLVGNVKDVSVDFRNKALAFRVTTKAHTDTDMSWDDVLSVEDVVLLKKEVQLHAATPAQAPPATVQAVMICPNCGTSAPGHAKFCPKCGASLK
jgi:sporulation protein YlmC with PRC-barrel domain/ribosomal protein L40E